MDSKLKNNKNQSTSELQFTQSENADKNNEAISVVNIDQFDSLNESTISVTKLVEKQNLEVDEIDEKEIKKADELLDKIISLKELSLNQTNDKKPDCDKLNLDVYKQDLLKLNNSINNCFLDSSSNKDDCLFNQDVYDANCIQQNLSTNIINVKPNILPETNLRIGSTSSNSLNKFPDLISQHTEKFSMAGDELEKESLNKSHFESLIENASIYSSQASKSFPNDNNEFQIDQVKPKVYLKPQVDENVKSPTYKIKWIKFKNKDCPIVTQNENGPCPLIAIINVLLLRGRITFPPSTKSVRCDQLIAYLADCILESMPTNANEYEQLNYEQNMHDAMSLFPKLHTGLDVNVQFYSIYSFEYTSELIIFDLLSIQLYHGWLFDPEHVEVALAIGNCSYNQLVDKIITKKNSIKEEDIMEALIAEQFLEATASQLTYTGLSLLIENVKEDELSILFRNNHFITLYKHENQLYQLVTDQGFLQEKDVVWETLNHIDNDDLFVNDFFIPISPKAVTNLNDEKTQIDQDYLIALSLDQEQKNQIEQNEDWLNFKSESGLNNLSDEELARQLQLDENQKFKKMQNASNQNQQDCSESESSKNNPSNSSMRARRYRQSRIHPTFDDFDEPQRSPNSNNSNNRSSGKKNCLLM